MKNDEKKIILALKNTFTKSKIPKNISKLKLGDIKEWDSLGNFHLILEIEKVFNCRFETKVFSEIKSIKDIKENLKKNGNK
jgi:acyl carrier protein